MKKLMSLMLIAVMLMTMACTALAADGTFTGEGAGKGGMIKVEVTVEGGEIAAINVVSHGETPGFADALDTVGAAMIAKNQVDVDGVTGATLSSNGLKAAVTAAHCVSSVKAHKRWVSPFSSTKSCTRVAPSVSFITS